MDLRQCVKLTREIFAQKAFDEFRGEEIRPGMQVSLNHDLPKNTSLNTKNSVYALFLI